MTKTYEQLLAEAIEAECAWEAVQDEFESPAELAAYRRLMDATIALMQWRERAEVRP